MPTELRGQAETPDDAGRTLSDLEDNLWAAAAFLHLASSGALAESGLTPVTPDDHAAVEALVAIGLVSRGDEGVRPSAGLAGLLAQVGIETLAQAKLSAFRQVASVVGVTPPEQDTGWGAHDDETLLAQGRASAFGGVALATMFIPSLDGLEDRFSSGGDFLDVGVGIGALTAAFCEHRPTAHVVGLDVLPRAVELARGTIRAASLEDRVELRLQAVQDLDDVDRYDLAWLPAPFIPASVFAQALRRVYRALRPGGWLVVAAGRFDGEPLAIAVTKWKTLRAGGTPLPSAEAMTTLPAVGFVDVMQMPTPVGAPALFAARK
jgi:precorrin-6B methylase 2